MIRLGAAILAVAIACAGQEQKSSVVELLQQALAAGDNRQVNALTSRAIAEKADLQTLLAIGGLLGEHDLLPESARVFENCVDRFPLSFEAHYNLALARLALHQPGQAADALRGAAASSPAQNAATLYLRGKIHEALGENQEARLDLESAYRANPHDQNYALDLALIYIRSAAYVPAIAVLEPASKQHPESRDIPLELALADVLAGRRAEAIRISRTLEQDSSMSPLATLISAFAHCENGAFRECAAESEAGLRLPQPRPYLYYLHATALWNGSSPDLPRIRNELDRAIAGVPHCTVCLELRSKVSERLQDDGAAVADLQQVVQEDAQAAPAWYRLSQLYKKMGRDSESSEALRRYRTAHDREQIEADESFRAQFLGTAPVTVK